MFWKPKKKQPVSVAPAAAALKPSRSVEENMIHMASIGISPSALLQYEALCADIRAATEKQPELGCEK